MKWWKSEKCNRIAIFGNLAFELALVQSVARFGPSTNPTMTVNNAANATQYAAIWKAQATPGRAAQRITAAANDCESRWFTDKDKLPEFAQGMLEAAMVLRAAAMP